ncbi:DoxX family protein [Reichenbachiella versicolor]|uniref:DoxX family protein n=1 Tax=Reichenbachiella versicolor TaxID=1821036 RepID=UPI000D6E5004|nr:DoxX family protein [Reichenbachiella versicolor]
MKKNKIIYYISTGLLTALMMMSAGMYFFNNAEVNQVFEGLGYPAYVVIPLAVAKLLGLVAIWTKKNRTLLEWAYAGFFFDTILAIQAHVEKADGEFAPAAVGAILVLVSYTFEKKA